MTCQFGINEFKTLQTSQVLDKMKQIEKDILMIDPIQPIQYQLQARWIKLKCLLELYGE